MQGTLKNADGQFPSPEILIQAPAGNSNMQQMLITTELEDYLDHWASGGGDAMDLLIPFVGNEEGILAAQIRLDTIVHLFHWWSKAIIY